MSYRPHPTKNRHLPEGYKGPIWWQLEIWPEGRKGPRHTYTFKGNEIEVIELHAELLRAEGKTTIRQSACPKLKDCFADFLAWYKSEVAASTITDFLYAWKRLEPFWQDYRLTHINNALTQQYKDIRLADGVTKRTINRELSYLSTIIRWAEDQEPPLIEPGTVKIKLFHKKQTKRQAPIEPHTMEEAAAIIDRLANVDYAGKNCNTKLHQQMARDRYGLVLLMYDAGLRKKEARLLEANRVNIPPQPIENYYGTITVIRKGNRVQSLPILTERLYEELKERTKNSRGYLYISPLTGKPYVDIRDGIKAAGKAAGVDKKNNPHLFRHDFVTHLHEMGADMKTIQELAGHSQLSTTSEVYSHLSANTLRSRAAGFANAINKPIRTKAELKVIQGGKKTKKSR